MSTQLKLKNKYMELEKFFDSYTEEFNLKNKKDQKNIQLKIDHSKRVVTNMEEIIAGLALEAEAKYLAKIIALYHDIGRFKQYQEYKTFSDYKSVDHGELGIEVIKENKLLADLNKKQQNIIYQAIKQHNQADLRRDNFENEAELFFARLIRDADKLDIFNIFVERYKKGSQKDYVIKLSTEPTISDEIFKKVLKGESINYDKLETINDLKAMQLGWIYDINFKETLAIIKKRGYVEIIYNSMDQSQQADEIYQQLKEYLN
ncbi:putative nucleotidyltransferase with HDIG domain [Halanaerobium saccharolyticum]|uniref:Putative nucleotidyltransferase with HDIG domain n=1 Tax=Halanaerobium saccharolyticum TaxID=43595 RepID=A0A4R7ZCH9_9FIRM|nr:HD domain-containing protein [Halanaerobium saccharolyticum]RAK12445.1 putative nucleotidyltransferase with HDIG domain [Halanaerobium saccharolyticum]TDW06371.1 putative nucleotidyltransferase with HDIG domain [Halanaerobium saccharolyticum]TDX61619.1 putative nucleotidyltransferase with HDIG domain [Halanaerobium saccharolyticum]